MNDLNNSNIKSLKEKFKNLGHQEFTKGICLVGDRAGNKLQKYHLTNRIKIKIIKSLYLSMMINFHLFKILVKYKF